MSETTRKKPKKLTKKERVARQKRFDKAVDNMLKAEGLEGCKDAIALKRKGYMMLSADTKTGVIITLHKQVGRKVIKLV
jgi:hypothetical protein